MNIMHQIQSRIHTRTHGTSVNNNLRASRGGCGCVCVCVCEGGGDGGAEFASSRSKPETDGPPERFYMQWLT